MSRLSHALLVAGILALATPAAATTFDGTWNVRITASKGVCEGIGTSYPIQISNGGVSSESAPNVSGRVGDTGTISVTVGRGYQRATGSGWLSAKAGSGTWRGSLCSGTWTAQRI